jgi:hypothetical protein
MSKKKKIPITPQQLEVLKAVCRNFDDSHNRVMERTASIIIPLVSYAMQQVEDANQALDGINTPFWLKVRNDLNGIYRACEKYTTDFEGLLVEGGMQAFGEMTDSLFPCLDSWFDVITKGKDVNPSLEVRRRAKLRYHDPYVAKIKECQNAFEDGYEKGYCDCVNDVTKELAKLVQQDIETAVINIENGKVNIEPVLKDKKP